VSDARLRAIEREAARGDTDAAARLRHELCRAYGHDVALHQYSDSFNLRIGRHEGAFVFYRDRPDARSAELLNADDYFMRLGLTAVPTPAGVGLNVRCPRCEEPAPLLLETSDSIPPQFVTPLVPADVVRSQGFRDAVAACRGEWARRGFDSWEFEWREALPLAFVGPGVTPQKATYHRVRLYCVDYVCSCDRRMRWAEVFIHGGPKPEDVPNPTCPRCQARRT
jgi:hypothetical protein